MLECSRNCCYSSKAWLWAGVIEPQSGGVGLEFPSSVQEDSLPYRLISKECCGFFNKRLSQDVLSGVPQGKRGK